MDYERAYKQALERAKQFSEKPYQEDSAGIVEYIFPELKESEDERIRKSLIDWFSDTHAADDFRGIAWERIVAWLEKQCGQKPVEWSEEDSQFLNEIILDLKILKHKDTGEEGKAAYQKEIDWLNEVRNRFPPQPKQEWSEENDDEAWLNDIICKVESDCILNKDEKDWLKSIKDRVLPKVEWSEEDEKQARQIERIVHNDGCTQKLQKQIADWLKSLKDRVQPQNRWKPSDEQMKLLREVQQALLGKDCHNRFVNFMYELKRLREE